MSPSSPVDQLKGFELLHLWEVVKLAIVLADFPVIPPASIDVTVDPAVEEANSQIVMKW